MMATTQQELPSLHAKRTPTHTPARAALAGPHEPEKAYADICETAWLEAQVRVIELAQKLDQLSPAQARLARAEAWLATHDETHPRHLEARRRRVLAADAVADIELALRVDARAAWLRCRDVWICLQHLASAEALTFSHAQGWDVLPVPLEPAWFWEQLNTGLPVPGPWPPDPHEGWIEHEQRLFQVETWDREGLTRIVRKHTTKEAT